MHVLRKLPLKHTNSNIKPQKQIPLRNAPKYEKYEKKIFFENVSLMLYLMFFLFIKTFFGTVQ
jgi:hypothetical protein